MERRAHPRTTTDHGASLSCLDLPPLACRVRDFSAGGLFVQLERKTLKQLLSKAEASQIRGVNGTIALIGNGAYGKLIDISVAHLCDAGLGVAFTAPDGDLLTYLMHHKESQSAQSPGHKQTSRKPVSDPAIQSQLLQELQKLTAEHISDYFNEFAAMAGDSLLSEADSALSNDERTDLLFASSRLEKERAALKKLLLQQIAGCFTGLYEKRTEIGSAEQQLDLVDPEEFDEWIVIVGIARRYDSSLLSSINRFERILGRAIGNEIANEESPFSPYSLLWALKQSLQSLGFSLPAKIQIYRSFQASVLYHIPELYEKIKKLFSSHGLEEANEPPPQIRRSPARRTPEVPTEIEEETSLGEAARVHRKADVAGALSALSPYSSLAPLKRLSRQYHPSPGGNEHQVVSQEAVLHSLQTLPEVQSGSMYERICRQIAYESGQPVEQVTLDDLTRNSIETTESLVTSIEQDEAVGGELKALIADLELPLVSESIDNPEILNDPEHPGRRLLQMVGELAPYLARGSDDRAEQPLVDALKQIRGMLKKRGVMNLQGVEKRMETILKLQRQEFEQNIAVVLRSAQIEETRQRAQAFVHQFMQERLTPDPVPQVIEQLLELGWAGLLAKTAATHSRQSREWKEYSSLFERLKQAFAADRTASPLSETQADDLIALLQRGFKEYPVFSGKAEGFIESLRLALQDDPEQYTRTAASRVTFTPEMLIGYLPDYQPDNEATAAQISADLKSWAELASSIRLGDWIIQHDYQQQPRLLNLAWKSTNSGRFVFVDGGGHKVLDLSLELLARQLKAKTYSILENGELPLVDRAVHRLLRQTYDQFRGESDRDELTGLLSRKAFQRLATQAMDRTRLEQKQHVFITLDIDQFKMINDICGIEGGDGLLISVAGLLNTYSPGDAALARVGDDEFGILLNDCTLQRGYEIAERQRAAIESFRYNWDETTLSITSSVGVVLVDSDIRTITDLMNASVAACNQARQEGRNCTRVYQPTAEEYTSRRRLIRSVPVIEQALEKDHLKLFGQRIMPLTSQDGAHNHYEILLRVYDDENRLSPPVEFIQAAEQYDRMRLVDRWVVNRTFDWLDRHHARLPTGEGLSVNLSAQSLTDRVFADYLLNKLKEAGFPPGQIAFEITETAFVSNMERVRKVIQEIKSHGCRFYLDDFGSGYSSYSYLKEFPVDVVKIDGIFVKDMLTEKSSYAMVKSITEVAHFMDKKVVAEFVSTPEILEALRRIGVDYAQGFAVGKPLDIDELLAHDGSGDRTTS